MTGIDSVHEAVETAEPINAEAESIEEAVARFAALRPLEYDQVRKGEAKRLKMRVHTLDKMVTQARGNNERDVGGSADFLKDVAPWPEPVNGAELLHTIVAVLKEYIILPSGAAEVIALWIIFAHAHDSFQISPILTFTSPTPECGKTTCMTLLGAMVPRPCPASNITTAALFRAMDILGPTLLIDEADTFMSHDSDMRGVINCSHHRANSFVWRVIGDNHILTRFRCWAPKALALIGKLHPTLGSRSIHVELQRKRANEIVKPLRCDRLQHLEHLCRQAARWALDYKIALGEADPEVPEGMSNRTADNWRPLLAIADLAGGEWPQRARRVGEAFASVRHEQMAGVMLLEDIKQIFADHGCDRLFSADISVALSKLEHRPWAEWHQGRPITQPQVAKLLKSFGVIPSTVRTGVKTGKGYKLEDFKEPFERYTSVTPTQVNKINGFTVKQSVTTDIDVTALHEGKGNENGSRDVVTVYNGNVVKFEQELPDIPAHLRRTGISRL